MKKLLLIFLSQIFVSGITFSQSFTIDDLLALPYMPPKNIDHFMDKNGFSIRSSFYRYDTMMVTSFFEKIKSKSKDSVAKRSVEIYKKNDTACYVFHTSSLNEYLNGQKQLIKAGFFYDNKKDLTKAATMLFQKKNITILTKPDLKDEKLQYTFLLQKKELPDPNSIQFAEDLLIFNSHEYLVSFFGEKNVKKDLFYFSDKELRKCSVLFGYSSRQAVFVWGDENNLCDLTYILVSNIIPTVSAEKYSGVISMNEWEMENGIRLGMSVKELLILNEKEFKFYGNQSELAFMVKPDDSGKIDFRKTVVMLTCNDCNNDRLFDKLLVNAVDAAVENLPMHINGLVLLPVRR